MTRHSGECHCGAVRLTVSGEIENAATCNCSLCRRLGALWYHCDPARVSIEGAGVAYRHGDETIDCWHCGICGCTTHWTPVDPDGQMMAVNLYLFEPKVWRELPVREIDGASF